MVQGGSCWDSHPLVCFHGKIRGFGVCTCAADATAVPLLPVRGDILLGSDPVQRQFPLLHSVGLINVLIASDT